MALNRASYKIYNFFFFFQINLAKKEKQRFYRFNYFNALFVYYVSNKRVYKRKTGVLFLLYFLFFPQNKHHFEGKTLAQLDINFHGHVGL